MKEQEPDHLKMAIDSMVDDEVEGPRVILGPVALKHFFTLVRNAAVQDERTALAELCDAMGSPHIAKYLREQAAIESLKEPTP